MANQTLLSIAAAAAAATIPAGCGAPAARPSAPDVEPSPDALVVAVRATEFGFEPATVRIPAGKPVRLELTNAGQIEHDVMFRDLPATAFRIPRGQHLHDRYPATGSGTRYQALAGRSDGAGRPRWVAVQTAVR